MVNGKGYNKYVYHVRIILWLFECMSIDCCLLLVVVVLLVFIVCIYAYSIEYDEEMLFLAKYNI